VEVREGLRPSPFKERGIKGVRLIDTLKCVKLELERKHWSKKPNYPIIERWRSYDG